MKTILTLGILFLVACSNSNSGGQQQPASSAQATGLDPIYSNTWYYQAPGSTDTKSKGLLAYINEDLTIQFVYFSAIGDGASLEFYFRKNAGTFERNNDIFKIKYSHETCNPLLTETLHIKFSNNQLVVKNEDESEGFILLPATSSVQQISAHAIEDKNCNMITKSNKQDKRSIASSNLKSVFDLVK